MAWRHTNDDEIVRKRGWASHPRILFPRRLYGMKGRFKYDGPRRSGRLCPRCGGLTNNAYRDLCDQCLQQKAIELGMDCDDGVDMYYWGEGH